MDADEGIDELADALAELAHHLWQQEQEHERTAAKAAASADEPASAIEAKQAG